VAKVSIFSEEVVAVSSNITIPFKFARVPSAEFKALALSGAAIPGRCINSKRVPLGSVKKITMSPAVG